MSEPRKISPMLDDFTLIKSFSEHNGVECFSALKNDSDKRFIVKKISLPASQVEVDALLIFNQEDHVRKYYRDQAEEIVRELEALNTLADLRGFVPALGCQIEPMEAGLGSEVYILTRFRKTLARHMQQSPMTHLGALNLGIDMCAAMAVARENGWMYVDLKPENIYLFTDQEYRIGDLGFVSMENLKHTALPNRYRSVYTAPEVVDASSSLNATMDTYALGLILYQVFNGGKLPFEDEAGRAAWLEKLASGSDIAAPVCADAEMAAIITRACAYDPADRWQTPSELGHALVSYMQSNGAEDIPLTLPEQPEPEHEVEEPAPVEEPAEMEEIPGEAIESTEADDADTEISPAIVEEPADNSVEIEATMEENKDISDDSRDIVEKSADIKEIAPAVVEAESEISSEITPAVEESVEANEETTVEVEQVEDSVSDPAETTDWIDLMDAILSEDAADHTPDEEEPSLRELLGDEDYINDAHGVTADDVSAETADILSFAQELIDHEAPAPVVAPEPIDIPIPEPLPIDTDEISDEDDAQEDEEPFELNFEDDEEDAEDISEPEPDASEAAVDQIMADEEEKSKRRKLWKKLLGTLVGLAAAAGIAFGAWYFYQNYYLQAIDSMSCEGSATEVVVTVDTAMDQSKLNVICKDTYGNTIPGKLEDGIAVFSDLTPGTQYIITLEPEGFHKLLGTTSVTYSTPAETQIMHLTAVTGQEPGSAIVSFGVEGRDSEHWTLTCTAEGVEPVSIDFNGHTATVTGLTVGTEYTFTLSAPEEILLVGETSITHTASELVQASNLALADYTDGVITVSWTAPEDVAVERWIVRCFDNAGYDQLQEISGTTAAFTGITEGGKYTVEVTAATMTLGTRAEITADRNSITGFEAVLNGNAVELTWNFAGAIPEGGWKIAWSADGGPEQILTTEENKAVLSPAAPGSSYSFTIVAPEDAPQLTASAAVETPAAGTFSANKLDSNTIIVEMFDVPSKSNWGYNNLKRAREQDTFPPGGSLALLYTVTKPYSFDSAEFETIFVIRDAEGKLISASTRTRVWDDMWDNGYCTETVSGLPAAAGEYKLSIYIENGLLAELPFTIK